MDAQPPLELNCDSCGYSRRGIPTDARCPECGAAAPRLLGDRHTAIQTEHERLWLRGVTIGLVLLMFFSIAALQVTLIMPVGSFSLGTMNFPGPKLVIMTAVQRSIGNQPGEWGVAGMVATFMQIVGIWLITETPAMQDDREAMMSLRRLTRWSSIFGAGAVFGIALGGSDGFFPPMGNLAGSFLVLGIVFCELPANTLLYRYLHSLAVRVGNRRAARAFGLFAWALPALIAGGALLILADRFRHTAPAQSWYAVTAAYGAAAIAAGAAAWTACGHLLATLAVLAFGDWFTRVPSTIRQWPSICKKAAETIERDWPRWMIVLGIALWLLTLPGALRAELWKPGRIAYFGNLPLINWIGPHVVAGMVVDNIYSRFDSAWNYGLLSDPVFLGIVAVWLITVPREVPVSGRRIARWFAICSIGAMVGVSRGRWGADAPPSIVLLGITIICCEAPATFFIYRYLAKLADEYGARSMGLQLRQLSIVILLTMLAPLAVILIAHATHQLRDSTAAFAMEAFYMMISTALTFIAIGVLARLAWMVARHSVASSPETPGEPAAGI